MESESAPRKEETKDRNTPGYRKQREYDCLLHPACAGNLRSSAKAMKYARSSATATSGVACSDKSNVACTRKRDGTEQPYVFSETFKAKGKCQKAKARSKQTFTGQCQSHPVVTRHAD
jgi:hypothetical protein